MDKIKQKLSFLYPDQSDKVYQRLMALIDGNPAKSPESLAVSERDVMLIVYGDHVRRADEAPLKTLHDVLGRLALPLTSVHILPFYPYSSDDGFSVIDYYQIDPALGDWSDVHHLSKDYRLMFDAVFNHISAHSEWFQAFLRGEAPYKDYFVSLPKDTDVSSVTRPRTHPLLTPFETASGTQYIWTTFSDDQIDLNAENPDVLIELIKTLLFYVEQGAQYIRLDAIAFLWKEVGTTSIHLPQTHTIIQLMRDVLDIVAPQVILITETNVPHLENISYFGDGQNEAQMVYQFTLPPMILHTMHTANAQPLTQWAQTIQRASDRTSFFNFTASHDGIGMRPLQGILSADQINALVQRTLSHGGFVSYKSNSDGSQSPYELNITYFDAITDPAVTESDPDTAVDRFMVSQAIMLSVVGVPGIYLHSLLGSRNDREGVNVTGRYRTINREKLDADLLLRQLNTPDTLRNKVFNRYRQLLEVRTAEPAFHPLGDQLVHDLHAQVFAVERVYQGACVIALHNISGDTVTLPALNHRRGRDLFSGSEVDFSTGVTLRPYQILWAKMD